MAGYSSPVYRHSPTPRAGAADASCEFTREMIHNLERAVEHPDMTPELAALLSTSQVELEYEVQSGIDRHDIPDDESGKFLEQLRQDRPLEERLS